ncbi:28368_t:CDS:2, partial [Gigaspora margarita]
MNGNNAHDNSKTNNTMYPNEENLNCLDQFRFIDGRRYHNEDNANYYFPNDKQESDRLRTQHFWVYEIWKGNFSSPLKQKLENGNMTVLDIGCGDGTWTLACSATYPNSTFVGVDFSPIFPSPSSCPPNAGFLQHNVLEGLPFPENTLDFVFMRFMSTFTQRDWEQLMSNNFFESKNIKLLSSFDIKSLFEKSNRITDIHCEERSSPIGKWAGRVGQALLNIQCALMGIKPFLAPFMNISDEQFKHLIDKLDVESNDNHAYKKNVTKSNPYYLLPEYDNIVRLETSKVLNPPQESFLDCTQEEIKKNFEALKSKLAHLTKSTMNLNWYKNFKPDIETYFFGTEEKYKCEISESIYSKCDEFVNSFGKMDIPNNLKNITHDKISKTNTNIFMPRNEQSEGTYISDVIMPLLRATLTRINDRT